MSERVLSKTSFANLLAWLLLLSSATTLCAQQAESPQPSEPALQLERLLNRSPEPVNKVDPGQIGDTSRRMEDSDQDASDSDTDSAEDLQQEVTKLLNAEQEDEADGDSSDDQQDSDETDSEDRPTPIRSGIEISTDIRDVRTNIGQVDGTVPSDRSDEILNALPEAWLPQPAPKLFAWSAPDISYQPLYFEDVALERYGQTPCGLREPIVSAAHFFKSAALLPYQLLQDDPCDCEWPLGFCRPGSAAPYTWQKHFYGLQ